MFIYQRVTMVTPHLLRDSFLVGELGAFSPKVRSEGGWKGLERCHGTPRIIFQRTIVYDINFFWWIMVIELDFQCVLGLDGFIFIEATKS